MTTDQQAEPPMPDGGPCPICDKLVARVLLEGHLELHRKRGEDEWHPHREDQ